MRVPALVTPNVIDRLAGFVSPSWQAGRLEARARSAALLGATAAYDAASRSHRTAGRRIASSSANRETFASLARLRDVSRELGRNNPYARRAIDVLGSNIVGPGIMPTVECAQARLKSRVQGLVEDHLETPAIDFDGRLNLYGLQNLAMRTIAESGEVLIVRYRPQSRLKLKVPLQVRVLDPDYLNVMADSLAGQTGNRIVQGIEFDPSGRRVAYHLFAEHPGDLTHWNFPKSNRVPAEDVIHLYRLDRPGQVRGIPWGAPAVMTLWDLADYEDAELMRQKIAACFAVFWIDGNTPTKLATDPRAGTTQQGLGVDMIEPGMQQRLPQGSDVKFATPPGIHGYEPYVRAQIRKAALAYGVPYETIAGDLSQVNFSSGRMGWLEFQRGVMQAQWHMLIPHMCCGIGHWFLEDAEFAAPGASKCRLKHTEPRREMIDPTKDIPAARDAIRSGLSSRSEELRKLGYDPLKVDAEIASDQERQDELKMRLDSDGRHGLQEPAAIRGPAALSPQADSETASDPKKETEDA